MTQPTVPPNDGRVSSHVGGTPASGPFQIDFPFMNLGEIVVELLADGALVPTILVYGSQYTVAATPQDDGSFINGTIMLTTPVSNTTVTRFRNTFIQRLSNYPLTGFFDRLSLNAEMNRFVMAMQDFQRRLTDFGGDGGGGGGALDPVPLRLLQTPGSEAPVNVVAQLIATRGSKILAWDAAGNLINSGVTLAQVEAVATAGVPNLALYALLDSPVFTGTPTVPNPPFGDNDTSIATTKWVRDFAGLGPTGAAGGDLTGSYPNPQLVAIITAGTLGGSGKYVAFTVDAKGRITAAVEGLITPASIGAAPIDTPAFVGNPTVPDPSPPNSNNQTVANTKFVNAAVAGAVGGSIPTGPAGGDLDSATSYPAPLIKSDVVLRGNPTLQTSPPVGDNDLSIASTKFVKDQAYQTIAGMPTSLPPLGSAGGHLAGTYPNPAIKPSATDGQVLTTVAGVATWAAAAGGTGDFFTAIATSGFGASPVTVLFPAALSGNTGNWYNPANGRYTPPPGRYHMFATVGAGVSTGATLISVVLRKNGVAVIAATQVPGASNWAGDPSVVANLDANGTDWFDIQCSCNNGSNISQWMWFGAFSLTGMQGPVGPMGPAFTRPVMQMVDEQVLGANGPELRVNIPVGAKAIELWFSTVNVANVNDTLLFNGLNGATILNSANYSTQYLFGIGTTPQASVVAAATSGQIAGGVCRASGVLRFQTEVASGITFGSASGYASNAAGGIYALANSYALNVTPISGYRLSNIGQAFLAGSYLRCLALL